DCYWNGPAARSYSFQDGVYPTAGYDGTQDLNIASAEATTNQDASAVNCVDYNGDGCVDVGSGIVRNLMQWDISSVSSECTVSGGSITVDNNVTNGDSVHRFGVQAMRRDWGESTATWNTYDGSTSWTTAGAGDTSDDRYATDLMNGNSDGGWGRSALGVLTFNFDADGVAQLQSWINGTVDNNGIIIADNDTGDINAFLWRYEGYGTASSRPKLTIYCRNSFRLRGGVSPVDVPSTTGILCITDPFTCLASSGSCTNVTLTAGGCIGAASTKTMATGSSASGNYWLKEADWAQGIPAGTTPGVYTTVITWDLQ
ncbi:MAG: DNRLRE domain-containing protein, partial [Patescibacteria group bacterium]|nr:DNRLRE domain-containing protein [Patescibacteria group bacterium]